MLVPLHIPLFYPGGHLQLDNISCAAVFPPHAPASLSAWGLPLGTETGLAREQGRLEMMESSGSSNNSQSVREGGNK